MEGGLLSDPKLKPYYDKVEWMYLFQDFSGSDADREAQRIAIRFGISSWPQHFLVAPYTMEVLGSTGRSLESFSRAVDSAKVTQAFNPTKLAALDAEAAALETLKDSKKDNARAAEALKHEDIVIKLRSLEHLAKADTKALLKAADDLLATPNDQVRFTLCQILAKEGDESAREALEKLVKETPNSKNPNVLRINAVKALAKCGNEDSIDVIAPYACSREYNNGLTGVSIDALLALGEKSKKAKTAAADALKNGFPALPDPIKDAQNLERAQRSCAALAKRVHDALLKLTGKRVAFPAAYDEKGREELIKAWAK